MLSHVAVSGLRKVVLRNIHEPLANRDQKKANKSDKSLSFVDDLCWFELKAPKSGSILYLVARQFPCVRAILIVR